MVRRVGAQDPEVIVRLVDFVVGLVDRVQQRERPADPRAAVRERRERTDVGLEVAHRAARVLAGREPDRRTRNLAVGVRDVAIAERRRVFHAGTHERDQRLLLLHEVRHEEAEQRVVEERACERGDDRRLLVRLQAFDVELAHVRRLGERAGP